MICLSTCIKRSLSFVMILLLLCTATSPSVFATDMDADTAEDSLCETATPSDVESADVVGDSFGVFDQQTMTVSECPENTTIEEYVALFENEEQVETVVVLKDDPVN